jgi:hypothetical protein
MLVFREEVKQVKKEKKKQVLLEEGEASLQGRYFGTLFITTTLARRLDHLVIGTAPPV